LALRIVATVTSGALWFYSVLLFAGSFGSGLHFIGIFLVAPVGLFFSIAVHEFGHAAAAHAVGWRVIVVVIGPLGFQVPNRDFAWVSRAKRRYASGWVLAAPPTLKLATNPRDIGYTAGGPIASLGYSISLFVGASLLPDPGEFSTVYTPMLCGAFGVQSLAIFIGTIIPYVRDSSTSDGYKILAALKQQPIGVQGRSLSWLAAMLQASVRLRNLPEWMVQHVIVSSQGDEGIARFIDSVVVGRALDVDSPDIPAADRLLNDFRARYGVSHWLVACEAFLAAAHEHNPGRAKAALAELEQPSDIPQLTLAAEAAIAMLEGQRDIAKRKCSEMIKIVRQEKDFPDVTYRDLERKVFALAAC
jgi:hypothetical protein